MTVEQLARLLEERIPCALSEPWDHDGRMIVPDGDAAVTRVLCALDCTSDAIQAAIEQGCNVILTHHPLLFHPLGSLCDTDSVGKRALACVRAGIAVLSYHTRLDSMAGGVNDCLAHALGMENVTSFLPFGRVGEVKEQSFGDFCAFVQKQLHSSVLPCVDAGKPVRRVAIVSGGGKDEIPDALRAGADTYVTGEVNHNQYIDCRELGLNLICGTHHATERVVLPFLAELVRGYGLSADVWDADPLVNDR